MSRSDARHSVSGLRWPTAELCGPCWASAPSARGLRSSAPHCLHSGEGGQCRPRGPTWRTTSEMSSPTGNSPTTLAGPNGWLRFLMASPRGRGGPAAERPSGSPPVGRSDARQPRGPGWRRAGRPPEARTEWQVRGPAIWPAVLAAALIGGTVAREEGPEMLSARERELVGPGGHEGCGR